MSSLLSLELKLSAQHGVLQQAGLQPGCRCLPPELRQEQHRPRPPGGATGQQTRPVPARHPHQRQVSVRSTISELSPDHGLTQRSLRGLAGEEVDLTDLVEGEETQVGVQLVSSLQDLHLVARPRAQNLQDGLLLVDLGPLRRRPPSSSLWRIRKISVSRTSVRSPPASSRRSSSF